MHMHELACVLQQLLRKIAVTQNCFKSCAANSHDTEGQASLTGSSFAQPCPFPIQTDLVWGMEPCFLHHPLTLHVASSSLASAKVLQVQAVGVSWVPKACSSEESKVRPSIGTLGVGAFAVGAVVGSSWRRRRRVGQARSGKQRTARQISSSGPWWPLDPSEAKTLKQVIVVHRHGTRFPTKPTGAGNLSWPQRAQFWESYKGHLTPVGGKTLQDTGAVLRHRYIGEDGGLFKGCRQVDGRVIGVYTSNVQRTLQSAWSFLLGLVPDASIFFAFRSERVFSDALRQAVGVPIYVEDATEGDDKLFHEWKIGKGYKKWNDENLKRSEFLEYAKSAPEYQSLLDKLYEVTHERKLEPGGDPLKRLTAAKDVDTQVMIEEAHNRPVLPNELGEPLHAEEKQLLRNIGNEVKRCWFGDARGDVQESYGQRGAGYLAHKIWRHMDEKAKFLCHQRFVQFSCHDTTMCALAAHLGIELPEIGFGSFFTFELHFSPDTGDFVKFYYNSKPDAGERSYADLKPLVLPLGREPRLVPLGQCATGSMSLEDFRAHCQIPGQEETFELFMKLLARADMGPTRESLEALLEDGKHGWLSFPEWQERYDESFRAFDTDGNGSLDKEEMQTALAEWYGITGRTVDLVFHLVDRDPEIDALTELDTYLAMCALVGVRGSISSKTADVSSSPLPESPGAAALIDNVDLRSSGGTTKLMNAANTGDLPRVKDLIAQGADVNATDEFGWTALRYAVRKKDTAICAELINLGADVNLGSTSGRTPLMSAVANNAPNVVQLLVDNGADLAMQNRDGLTAHAIASRGGGMGSSVVRAMVAPRKEVA
ncbi:unnamed protein product [Polarella glacialis]|uniref:EF-hand domain-containing protein n=1 Tax=Polarella glacialis TaxID=89957 RepID=A0A813IV60_POLGL|nr:unnamed protein product [Polarella glacialis]